MMFPFARCAAAAALTAVLSGLAGCAAGTGAVVLPPAGSAPDYQLGGAYDPDPQVGIVGRDFAGGARHPQPTSLIADRDRRLA